jgi:hypothetical protein
MQLNFEENSVQNLSLDDLKKTVDECSTSNEPLVGIRHHVLFDKINEILDRHGLKFKEPVIWAAHNKAKINPGVTVFPDLEREHGEKSLQSTLLRRLFGQYTITSKDTGEINSAIAISYHQSGIQVAWGPNVKVCSNLCIMNYDDVVSTYGQKDKVGHDKLLEIINSWSERFNERIEDRIKSVEEFKTKPCSVVDVCNMLGSWTLKRVGKDKFPEHVNSPMILNQGQISKLAERYIEKTRVNNEPVKNAYEFYNTVTDMLKPGDTDIPSIINQNVALSQFIKWYYKIQ